MINRFVLLLTVMVMSGCVCGLNDLSCIDNDKATNCDMRDLEKNETGRKKNGGEDLMSRILPMLAMPFITSLTFLPMMLVAMKFTLIKAMFLGKLAIIFTIFNILRNLAKRDGAVFSHNINLGHQHAPHQHYPHHN